MLDDENRDNIGKMIQDTLKELADMKKKQQQEEEEDKTKEDDSINSNEPSDDQVHTFEL